MGSLLQNRYQKEYQTVFSSIIKILQSIQFRKKNECAVLKDRKFKILVPVNGELELRSSRWKYAEDKSTKDGNK